MLSLQPGAIGGVNYFSTVDWPGKIVSTIFLRGCPWRCDYCHNYELIDSRFDELQNDISWSSVYAELQRRSNFIDGVVISGGEPLFQTKIKELIVGAKSLGLLVGLHTNGVNPSKLQTLLQQENQSKQRDIDWIGLDIKAPRSIYADLTHSKSSAALAFESLDIVLQSKIDHEVRTTLDPHFFASETVLIELAEELADHEVQNWVLQRCRENDDTHGILHLPFKLENLVETKLSHLFKTVSIR